MRLTRVFFLFFFFLWTALQAEEFSEEGVVVIPVGEVLQGPYFAVGDLIDISGKVLGDAFLIGTQVIFSGEVEGNLYVISGNFEMSGKVLGNLWALSGGTVFAGVVEQDAHFLSASLQMEQTGVIQKDLLICAGNVDFLSQVGDSVTAFASNFKLEGTVLGNVRSFAGKLRVGKTARIGKDLSYRSNQAGWIDSQAEIGGEIHYKRSFLYDALDVPFLKGVIIGSKVLAFLMNFVYTFVIGVILIRMFPKKLQRALSALEKTPKKSLLYGIVLLILLPIASLILLATVIGAPFALTLIALNIVSFYTVKIFVILWAVNAVFKHFGKRPNTLSALATGQILYCFLTAIPFVGTAIALCCMVLGLGAVAVSQTH
jgi:cytoskeletal protein CcmA (bactofilin family)